jgi:hypothetical protein
VFVLHQARTCGRATWSGIIQQGGGRWNAGVVSGALDQGPTPWETREF